MDVLATLHNGWRPGAFARKSSCLIRHPREAAVAFVAYPAAVINHGARGHWEHPDAYFQSEGDFTLAGAWVYA